MTRVLILAALIALPGTAMAQTAGTAPDRVRSITLTGDQKCPQSTANEIVVCSRLDEPYRIPRTLRDDKPIPTQNQSWVNRAAAIDQAGRVAGGLPDTCSPVGTGGQSGCALQANNAYAAERRAQRAEAQAIP